MGIAEGRGLIGRLVAQHGRKGADWPAQNVEHKEGQAKKDFLCRHQDCLRKHATTVAQEYLIINEAK